MQVSKTLLEDILRRYGCGEGQVNDLAKEAGMLRAYFLKLAQDRGIPSRAAQELAKRAAAKADRETAAGQAKDDADRNPKPVPAAKAVKRKSKKRKLKPKAKPPGLVQHVLNTIESELTKLDKQTGDTSQDRERASRALKQMVASLETAVEMQRDFEKDKTRGGGAKDKEALAHAEDLRRKIVERIESLRLQRLSQTSNR